LQAGQSHWRSADSPGAVQRAADAKANLAELKKVEAWSQGDFVEEGGWAAVPGTNSSERVSAVAKACAALLAAA
jgi:hypothetical protein